MFRPV